MERVVVVVEMGRGGEVVEKGRVVVMFFFF